jgi:hypothetical protein
MDKQPLVPPAFVGGRAVPIGLEGWEQLGYWASLPEEAMYAVSIRFGWCPDLNEWYVRWSGIPMTRWMFQRREDAERAIVDLKATYDGEWAERQSPGGENRP